MRRALFALLFACGATNPSTPPTNVTSTFAIEEIFLGDTTRDSTTETSFAWKSFGRNIDGKISDATSTDVCTLAPNAPAANQVDGIDGIDNAFGSTLLRNMGDDGPSPSVAMTDAIQAGRWTLEIEITGLSDDPSQTSSGLVARAFEGAALDAPPAFDASTSWPVLSTSPATFPNATIDHGVFSSGPATEPLRVAIVAQDVAIPLVLHDAVLTFVHAAHDEAVEGTISGVLDVQELVASARVLAGRISTSLCGSAFDPAAAQIAASADILRDGTNASGVPCDGISVGFGFNARLVASPTDVVAAPPVVDPCAN